MKYFIHRSNRFFSVLATVMFMLCAGTAWGGEAEIYSTNFTSWTTTNVSAGSTSNGIYFKSATTITNGTGAVMNNNASTSQGFISIPLSDVNGSITVTVTFAENKRHQLKYSYASNATAVPNVASSAPSLSSSTKDASNTTSHSFTINNIPNKYVRLYVGRCGSDDKTWKTLTVTTPEPTTVYLKPGTNWRSSGARFAVYYYKSSNTSDNGWVSMTSEATCSSTPVYSAVIPNGYDKCIFCRMNGGTTANEWSNKWNQTGDLDVPTGNAVYYTVPDDQWDSGTSGWWQFKPFGICVSGTWLRFTGETITLTATCAGATHFQWYKGDNIELTGQTSSTLTITNCDYTDAGNYYCKAWRESGDANTIGSSIYGVKIPYLEYQTPGSGADYKSVPFTRGSTSDEWAECTVYPGVAWGYEFAINDGFTRYGNSGTKERSNSTEKWTMSTDPAWCKWSTDKEGTYHFYIDFSNATLTPIQANIVYPPMAQEGGVPIYMEKTAAMTDEGWNNLYYRIGKGKYGNGDDRNYATAQLMTLVPGTARFYQTATPDWDHDFWAWHIGNNCGSQGDGFAIYNTKSSSEYEITQSINFSGDEIPAVGWTIYVNAASGIGQDELNNNCYFHGYTHTSGMLQHNLSVGATTHGQIKVEYTHYDNTAHTSENYTARNFNGLAHTCIITITGVPDCGYRIASLKVNGVDFTSGSDLILTENATVTATFEQYNPITYNLNGGTINEVGYPTSYVLGIGATLPTDVTKDGFDFEGWFDNGALSGSPITTITTSDCGSIELWAKWGQTKPMPVFTWTYDATVKAGGIYPVSVSSTGNADVTITILESILGVSGSYTSGNPASGHTSINAGPAALTFTYQATSPATSEYKAKSETKTVTIEICEKSVNLPYNGITVDAGNKARPRYYNETVGVGLITKGTGNSSFSVSSDTWTGESWITKYLSNGTHQIRTYIGDVHKIVIYAKATSNSTVIEKLRRSSLGITSESDGENALEGATVVYNDDPAQTSMTKNVKETITITFSTPLTLNEFLFIKFSSSTYVYGVKLFNPDGTETTSVAWDTSIPNNTKEVTVGDDPFTYTASQTSTIPSMGTITYSSSDPQVASVDPNTGQVTILENGSSIITATLSAVGCFKDAITSYRLEVKSCKDNPCIITAPKTAKCEGESVVLTVTDCESSAAIQWYKDDVLIPGATAMNYNANEPGTYKAVATKNCRQHSNAITITDLTSNPTINAIYTYYYIKNNLDDFHSVNLALFEVTSADQISSSFDVSTINCSLVLEDNKVYLRGQPLITADNTISLTVTATNSCNSASANTSLELRLLAPTAQPTVAWVVEGKKGGGFTEDITSGQGAGNALFEYLNSHGYSLTAVNDYSTTNEIAIAQYYSQFDIVVMTDFPNSQESKDGKSYTNAVGSLIDKKPMLSMEAFVSKQPNWRISSSPYNPSPQQHRMKLLCAAHQIFDPAIEIGVYQEGADEYVDVITTSTLQGFTPVSIPDFIFIATIHDDTHGDLVTCCERQTVIQARFMILGIQSAGMSAMVEAPGKSSSQMVKQILDYLLIADPTLIADCSLVFDNGRDGEISGSGDNLWSNPANWGPNHGTILPTPYHAVRIERPCKVDVPDAHASSARLAKGSYLTKTYNGSFEILSEGALSLTGFIKRTYNVDFLTRHPLQNGDITIHADASNNGALIWGDPDSDVPATVDMYSKGTDAQEAHPIWQYIGTPFVSSFTAIEQFHYAWMCRWSYATGTLGGTWEWVENEDRVEPYVGYALTQASAMTYTWTGMLNKPGLRILPLKHTTDADGFAMLANSWAAPINIGAMEAEDFDGADPTIYIYNAGSYAQYEAVGTTPGDAETEDYTDAGQYTAVPVNVASYVGVSTISPMQGFFVQTTRNGSLTLDYTRIVMDTVNFVSSTKPMRAPKRTEALDEESEIIPTVMCIKVMSKYWGDKVFLLAHSEFSDAYELGWEGRKQEGETNAPYIAVAEPAGNMAVAAVNQFEERYLSFRAGNDLTYTFHFDYEGDLIYLYDIETGIATEIQTGNTYTFVAANKTPMNRFLITKNPPRTPTDLEEVNEEAVNGVEKFIHEGKLLILHRGAIYDALGKRVEMRKEGAQ